MDHTNRKLERGAICLVVASLAAVASADDGPAVRLDRKFFNPAVGQKIAVSVSAPVAGALSAEIRDRDGFRIRALPTADVPAGESEVTWDGRDDQGEIVPDEAYSLHLELVAGGRSRWTYEPARGFEPRSVAIERTSYSRVTGVLSYRLEQPSRVHIQAGQVTGRGEAGATGPVLKTLAANTPRVAGAVIETWSGFDESGKFYVPDLEGFAISILATPLPENSLITVGNRKVTFAEYARRVRPTASVGPRDLKTSPSRHHHGLSALEDQAPSMALEPCVVERAEGARCFLAKLDGDWVDYFLSQPTALHVFVDEREVLSMVDPENPARLELSAEALPLGAQRVVVNWGSRIGPTAIAVAPLAVDPQR